MSVNFEQCGKRINIFLQDPVGKLIEYLRPSRSFADKVYIISQNSQGYDTYPAAKVSGTEMGAAIDNGRNQR